MGTRIIASLCGILLVFVVSSSAVDTHKPDDHAEIQQQAEASLQADGAACGGAGCLRCGPRGCVKCRGVIVLETRHCADQCPPGYRESWSTLVDYMGRLCIESSSMVGAGWLGPLSGGVAGLGGRGMAVLVGAVSGAAICLVLLLAGCGWAAYYRAKSRRAAASPRASCGVYDEALVSARETPDQWLSPQELQTRREFAKQVGALRPDAPVFLAMLNDTRRKVRQLYRPNGTDSRSKAYRTVLRDLSRLLTLLNRPESRLGAPPADWEKLQAWAERSLRRYKKSSGGSSSGGAGSACSSGAASSASSTPSSSHALNQHHVSRLPPEVHQTHSVLQLPLPLNLSSGRESGGAQAGIEVPALLQSSAEWSQAALVNGLYYESFYPLGLRPQDEITTEL